jgi:hypothetical protein
VAPDTAAVEDSAKGCKGRWRVHQVAVTGEDHRVEIRRREEHEHPIEAWVRERHHNSKEELLCST